MQKIIASVMHESEPAAIPVPILALTQRLASGDEDAFREFHARYMDRLYVFLLAVTRGDPHAAEEALQETFVRVARHARPFADEDIFWSWLKAVARSAARDFGRKERRYLAMLRKFFIGWNPEGPGPVSEDHTLREMLETGLDQLDPLERRLIEGKYLLGKTVRELAHEEFLSEKAVESRLTRLRIVLRDALRTELQGGHADHPGAESQKSS